MKVQLQTKVNLMTADHEVPEVNRAIAAASSELALAYDWLEAATAYWRAASMSNYLAKEALARSEEQLDYTASRVALAQRSVGACRVTLDSAMGVAL